MAESFATENRNNDLQYQVVSIAIKNGKPLAMGVNRYRYSKNLSVFETWLHAEMDLLLKLGSRARNCKFYIYRFNNTSHPEARNPSVSKPCPFCQHLMKEAGVSRAVYLDENKQLGFLKNREFISLTGTPSNITKYFLHRARASGEKHLCL